MTFVNQTTGRSMTLERMEAEGESQLPNKVPGESFKFMILSPFIHSKKTLVTI